MARPYRHPDAGVYWFRRRVPEELRALLGKTEEKFSLRTRDPDEARIAHARATAEVSARWANLREGVRTISHKEAVAIAGVFYRKLVAENEDNPGDADRLLGRLVNDQAAAGSPQVRVITAGRNARGDYRPDRDADRFPQWEGSRSRAEALPASRYQLLDIFETFAAESGLTPATIKR